MRGGAAALLAVVIGGLPGPVGVARADDPAPYATSSATRYQVTFAARSCGSYSDVVAGEVRSDDGETLARPGRDSPYQPGQAVDADIEDGNDSGCVPLPGQVFTLGSGHERKGPISTVTGQTSTTPPTSDTTARLDPTGKDTGGKLAGAVTVPLTDEQVGLAMRRQLWVQGGTPDKPVGDGYAFGALRCAVDGRTAGNLQWLAFPPGVRHVFCYAYYVKGAADFGTVLVRMRTTRPVGYPQRVRFASGLSQGPDGGFALASSGDQVEAAFTRAPAVYPIRPETPAGWRVAAASCAASRADGRPAQSGSTVDATTGAASVTLAAGDVVVCTYSMDPPAPQPGLQLRLLSSGAVGTFGLTLDDGARQQQLTATTTADGAPVAATGADLTTLPAGRYRATVTPPTGQDGWTLTGALCNGVPATVTAMTTVIDLAPGTSLECVLALTRKPPALRLDVVTNSGVATAAFAVVPADDASAGWWAAANTTGYGVAETATGDVPADLPLGTYLVTAIPPRSTSTTGWRLRELRCDQGDPAPAGTSAVLVALAPGGPDPVCTATYQADPTTRLRITVRASGSRHHGTAVIEVSCVDGSGGRLVLRPDATDPAALPEPLAFLEPTDCTITQPVTPSMAKVSAVREPSTGDGPLELPVRVAVARDVTEYTIAVTDQFSEPVPIATRASFLDQLQAVPVILVGTGLAGIGALIFLALFLRHRST